MAAIRELYLTCLFLFFSQISGQWSGNDTKKQCGSSNLNIVFNFSLGTEHFVERSWYLNSTTNKIASANNTGFLTVEPPFSGRVTLNGTDGIILANANSSDSGSYLFIIVTDSSYTYLTATTTVIINEIPNNSCIPMTTNYINSITGEIPAACPGKDRIQAKWNDGSGSIGVLKCSSANTKYTCCAVGDPVTNCYNGSLCIEAMCKGTLCQLVLGLALGLGLGIQCATISIDVGIFIYTRYKHAYTLGRVLGLGLGVTFHVGWIIIASLIYTDKTCNECKLELGLGLGLGSGMPYLITGIITLIFTFFSWPIFKGILNRVEYGKGILTGILFTSVIGIIVVYLKYDILKRESPGTKHEDNPPKPAGKNPEQELLENTNNEKKTKNSGNSAVHTRTQNKAEPKLNQINDRQRPVPPANTGFEETPTFRQLPQPPQNGETKDRIQRGISATIDDTPGLASETPRPNRLLPLTPKQATVQKEDASEEPKKKRKKRKKKDQMNEETTEEENAETNPMVN